MCAEEDKDPRLLSQFTSQLAAHVFESMISAAAEMPYVICAPGENFEDIGIIEIGRRARKIAEILSGVDPGPGPGPGPCSCDRC